MLMGAAIASSRSKKQTAAKTGAPASEPAASAPASDDTVAEIKRFAELRDQGILTEEEFAAKKKKLLGL